MKTQERSKNERGFSYIDVLIAITIMAIGIMGLTSAIMYSLMRSQESEQRLYAKQIAQSAVESLFAARDVKKEGGVDSWNAIGNVGNNPVNGAPRGIFVNDWHPIREETGYDGVVGTGDDSCPGSGSCQVGGNPPNTSRVIPGYERNIVIEDVPDPERPDAGIMRRRVTVTVRYQVGGVRRSESIVTMIANISSNT